MSSEEVFGLAIHYFEEDEILEEEVKTQKPAAVVARTEPAKAKPAKPKQEETQPQLSLFDLL